MVLGLFCVPFLRFRFLLVAFVAFGHWGGYAYKYRGSGAWALGLYGIACLGCTAPARTHNPKPQTLLNLSLQPQTTRSTCNILVYDLYRTPRKKPYKQYVVFFGVVSIVTPYWGYLIGS